MTNKDWLLFGYTLGLITALLLNCFCFFIKRYIRKRNREKRMETINKWLEEINNEEAFKELFYQDEGEKMTNNTQKAIDQAINKLEIEWGYEGIKEEMYEIMKPILKDLEELEELKKIMGTPIQEVMRNLKVLEILKPYLKQTLHIKEMGDGLEISLKPITFYNAKVMDLDFNFNDTQQIENIRKVKEWLENDNK